MNSTTANTPTSPTVRKATRPGNVNSTGMTPANAHDSWKRVSNFAKARPWFASGASRCTIESNAILPMPEAMLATAANTMAAPTPPNAAAPSPDNATRTIAVVKISSSRSRLRSGEARPLPIIKPTVEATMTAPIHMLL
jgi:hypothetical protein